MSLRTPEPTPDSGPIETPTPKLGDRIGSYRLLRLIGEGASGRVFEVEHLTIGRRAAMKILAPEAAARPGAVKRLFAEAQAVNRISNPHIVEVTDLVEGNGPEEINGIVMELLEGRSLAQAMAQEGRMQPARFVPILAQVADALAAAHAARFIHRDLKPDNVFLTTHNGQPDHVKLLDFGLAKTIQETLGRFELPAVEEAPPLGAAAAPSSRGARRAHLTADGTFVGTPAYASPEQAAGRPLDYRTDIYSLGVILYELLCGQLPFEGRNFAEYLVKHLTQPPPPAPADVTRTALGRSLDAVARRCLAKEPAGRFASAGELRTIFSRLAAGEASLPGIVLGSGTGIRATFRSRRFVLAVAAAGVAASAGVVALVRPRAKPAAPIAARPGPPPPLPARRPSVVPLVPDKTVVLRFESQPPGAETRQVGDDQLLGLTPFRRTLSATGRVVDFEMRLPGYAPQRHSVVLAADHPLQVVGGELTKLVPAVRPARAHKRSVKKPRASRNATLNPFSR